MDAHDFVTFSIRRVIAPFSPDPPRQLLQAFLADYVRALSEAGCSMVGHIKGILEDGGSPPLFFSVTSRTGEPQMKGGPLKPGKDLTLSITVIVSGLEAEELSPPLDNSLARYFGSGPSSG
jgi:hypothetical protein